jgi:hypothetical protein
VNTPAECARIILLCTALPLLLNAGGPADDAPAPLVVETPRAASPIPNDRILGVIPNFEAVSDPARPYVRLPMRDKWLLFVKESADPYTFATSALGAALAQIGNGDPKYGTGGKAYLQRFGAAQADVTTQNFFSDALLASLFREDPRYFRMGPGRSVIRRIGYSLSRIVVTRRDSGRNGFNFSGVLGTGMGIFLSDAYYPSQSRGGGEVESRFLTSFASEAMGNLLPEFWPDIKRRLDRLKNRRLGHHL